MNTFKVSRELGVIFGWALTSKIGGQDHFDKHGDNVTDEAILEAAVEFMAGDRVAKEMHTGTRKGQVIFALPLTDELKKSFGITCDKSGLIVGIKPDDPKVLDKFLSGEYRGFSIGGSRIEDEEVAA